MTKQEVIDLMSSSQSNKDWRDNCDKVKAAHGGEYPDYWYATFISSGLAAKILNDPTFGTFKIVTWQ